ncbi:HNH endonuclease family protein [Leifsonia aquatica]|uniref:HNH endonuclease family protein n=1 Tax=Leifsonia aquatica TaxID=144185 RepID=UPI00385091EB
MSRRPARRVPRTWSSIALFVAVVGVAATATFVSQPSSPPPSTAAGAADDSTLDVEGVRAMLASVPDHSRTAVPSYDRVKAFGQAWQDVDGNGCSTRNDILARDLIAVVTRPDCTVVSGILDDPYTGRTIAFRYGVDTSAEVQVDHVVPLAYAWKNGAATWDAGRRLAYANDPRVLLAVEGAANQAKGAAGPAGWMPPNTAYSCTYVATFVGILHDYQLTIDPTDRAAITDTLTAC